MLRKWIVVCAFLFVVPGFAWAQLTPIGNPAAFAPSHTLQQFESTFGSQANWAGVNITWKGGNPAFKMIECNPRPFGPNTCPTGGPFTNAIENRNPFTGNFGGTMVIDFPSNINMIALEAAYNVVGSSLRVDFYADSGATFLGFGFGPPAPPSASGGGAPAGWVFVGFHSATAFNRVVLTANLHPTIPSGYMRLDNLRYDVGSPLTYCGDGVVNVAGEVCDDGNNANGDGCSAVCLSENTAPTALCSGATVDAGPACTAPASIDGGSTDPDAGDTITVSQAPPGPFSLGSTNVSLTVTDNHGATSSCSAIVNVADNTKPSISCPAAAVVECSAGTGNASISASGADNCSTITPNCTAATGSFPLGTTNYSCSAADAAGNTGMCSSSVTVVDTTAPVASCVAGVNPSGKNKPNENAGFRQVGGGDSCSAVSIKLGSYTLANGETIKITVDPSATGVTLVGTMGPLAIKHFVVAPGLGQIAVSDGVLMSTASCGS